MIVERRYSDEFLPLDQVPRDLAAVMKLMAPVMRYAASTYPKEAFADQTLGIHLGRVVLFWQRHLPSWGNATEGERFLWVHDIDEIEDKQDITAPEIAANPPLGVDKKTKGLAIAQKYLSPENCLLYQRWNKAGEFWRAESDNASDTMALAVKLIDIVDSDVVFHERIAEYCNQFGVESLDPGIAGALRYAFLQFPILEQRVQLIDSQRRSWFENILRLDRQYITDYWTPVSASRIPEIIREELSKWSKK